MTVLSSRFQDRLVLVAPFHERRNSKDTEIPFVEYAFAVCWKRFIDWPGEERKTL